LNLAGQKGRLSILFDDNNMKIMNSSRSDALKEHYGQIGPVLFIPKVILPKYPKMLCIQFIRYDTYRSFINLKTNIAVHRSPSPYLPFTHKTKPTMPISLSPKPENVKFFLFFFSFFVKLCLWATWLNRFQRAKNPLLPQFPRLFLGIKAVLGFRNYAL
jgi:hypothetical protein